MVPRVHARLLPVVQERCVVEIRSYSRVLSNVVVLKEHLGHLSRLQTGQGLHQLSDVDRMHDEDVWPIRIP